MLLSVTRILQKYAAQIASQTQQKTLSRLQFPLITRVSPMLSYFSTTSSLHGTVWEPDDVGLPPEIPEYETLQIQLTGYDFVPLEKFTKYVHNLFDNLGYNSESYAVPCKSVHIDTYRPSSTTIDETYDLELYERVVLVNNLPNIKLPIMISLLSCHTPEGVTFQIKHHTAEDEDNRYIPDRQLVELQGQLGEIAAAKKKK